MAEVEFLNFDNLGNGAARELFDYELSKVLANIQDPNTKSDAERAITLKVTFKPNRETRDEANIGIKVTSKLEGQKSVVSKIFIGHDVQGKPAAKELYADQNKLFPSAKENVTRLEAKEATN
jgi:hypothetical protein